jgi:hypothetical protein
MSSGRVPSFLPVASTIVSLVLLPIVINFATGGERWAWPVVVLLGVTAVSLTAWELLRRRTRISGRVPDHPRNRPNALARIDHYLRQRLQNSLAEKVRIALRLDERPGAVVRLENLRVQPVDGEEYRIVGVTDVDTVFREMQESLLILGAPGAGKTTLLLDLAQRLGAVARQDPTAPLPVFVDLARWSTSPRVRRTVGAKNDPDMFLEWLLRELHLRYTIPPSVGRAWLTDGKLALLLDGLDEVASTDQSDCIDQLNQLQERLGGPQLCVCSREEDYNKLRRQLHLQGAVTIRPLDREEVLDYCRRSEGRLDQVLIALERDEELWDLLRSPLMLNIIALAYQGESTEVVFSDDGPDGQRRMIFDSYIVEVLARRHAPVAGYTPERAIRCLALQALLAPTGPVSRGAWSSNLPRPMNLASNERVGAISFDRLVPVAVASALSGTAFMATLNLGVSGIVATILCSLLVMTPMAIRHGLNRGVPSVTDVPTRWKAVAVVGGFAVGLFAVSLGAVLASLYSTLSVGWATMVFFLSAGILATAVSRAGLTLLVALVIVVWQIPHVGSSHQLMQGYLIGLMSGTAICLIVDLGRQLRESSMANRVGRGSSGYLQWSATLGVATAALTWTLVDRQLSPTWLPLIGVCIGLLVRPEFNHPNSQILPRILSDWSSLIVLRLAMIDRGHWLLRWRRFLRFACDRSLLVEVNGEYQFVHALVEDHFAQCDPDILAARVRERMSHSLVAPLGARGGGQHSPG